MDLLVCFYFVHISYFITGFICRLVLANIYERITLASSVAIDASQGIVKISHIHAYWSNLYAVEWVSWLRYHCFFRVLFICLLHKAPWYDIHILSL